MAVVAVPPVPDMDSEVALAAKARDASKWLRKTKICVYYIQGDCKLGSKCNFAHSNDELQDTPNLHKTQLCQDFENGNCDNVNCTFAHGLEELRISPSYKKKICKWFGKGKCRNGDECGFAHGEDELRPPEPPTEVPTPPLSFNSSSPPGPPPGFAPPPGLGFQEEATDAVHKAGGVKLALEGRLLDTKAEAPLKEQVQELSSVIGVLQHTVEDMMMRKQITEMKQVVSQLSAQCERLSSIAGSDENLLQVAAATEKTLVPATQITRTPLKSLKTKLKSSAAPFVPTLNALASPFTPTAEAAESADETGGLNAMSAQAEPFVPGNVAIGSPMNTQAKPFVPSANESGDESTSVGTGDGSISD